MQRSIVVPLAITLLVAACKDAPGGSAAQTSASASASAPASAPAPSADGDADLLPAIEVTTPRPRYAIATLSDKQLARMVARAGWTPIVVGKSRPAEGPTTTIRVGAFQKTGGQQLEAAVLVRCRKPEDRPPALERGEAYFRDGNCQMDATAHLGVRNKSADSKRLLEAILAGSAD